MRWVIVLVLAYFGYAGTCLAYDDWKAGYADVRLIWETLIAALCWAGIVSLATGWGL